MWDVLCTNQSTSCVVVAPGFIFKLDPQNSNPMIDQVRIYLINSNPMIDQVCTSVFHHSSVTLVHLKLFHSNRLLNDGAFMYFFSLTPLKPMLALLLSLRLKVCLRHAHFLLVEFLLQYIMQNMIPWNCPTCTLENPGPLAGNNVSCSIMCHVRWA